MAGTDREQDKLRELVLRDRQELDDLRLELEQIGDQLRREHIRRAEQDRSTGGDRGVNQMCGQCFNSCKQPREVKIHHCARFREIG